MVANPEISRINGSKSKGPITTSGKANASRNAVKHGILSQQSPVLLTEDKEYFQNILQEINYEYNPKGPVELLLVRQIAMGWLRLNRLWNIEAATANLEILKIHKEIEFPEINIQESDPFVVKLLESLPKTHDRFLDEEIIDFEDIEEGLQQLISSFPSKSIKLNDWATSIWKTLGEFIYEDPKKRSQINTSNNFWKLNSDALKNLAISCKRL